MKEYSIHYKNLEEENFKYKYQVKEALKDINLKDLSQVFLKTYDKNLNEQECILYFCEFQNLNILKENNLKWNINKN